MKEKPKLRQLFRTIRDNRIFQKMMLSYCLVIFLGLGVASYFTLSTVVDILSEKISAIEQEVLQEVMTYSDDRMVDVKNIFERLYQRQFYDNNTSIIDYLNPAQDARIDRDNASSIIPVFLQHICNTSSFITDMYIVGFDRNEVFFNSNFPGRGADAGHSFFDSDFLENRGRGAAIEIIPAHIPDHINTIGGSFPVISYCLPLYDKNFMRFDNPLGLAIINVRADFFRTAYKNPDSFSSNIIVLSSDGTCLFDSEDVLTPGEPFPFDVYSASGIADFTSNENLIVSTLQSEQTGFIFISILDKQVIVREIGVIRRNINIIIVICIAVTLTISLLSATAFSSRIKALAEKMRDVERGELDTRIMVSSNDEIGYLQQSFNTMCMKLDEHIKSVYVFELETRTAQLKALQAQINPHALFNMLESIRVRAQLNKDYQTAKMISMLGSIFRWNIKMGGMFVKLSEEIEYITSYLELQKLRYDDAFDVAIDIPQSIRGLGVPKLILQPLVENAVQHGFRDKALSSLVKIEASRSGDTLTLTVTDNGTGMDSDKVDKVVRDLDEIQAHEGLQSIGLSNVYRRISILFGSGYGMEVSSASGEGTTIALTIPALSKEDMEQYVQSGNS